LEKNSSKITGSSQTIQNPSKCNLFKQLSNLAVTDLCIVEFRTSEFGKKPNKFTVMMMAMPF